jgi:SAM-dependent methyltransferase
VEVGPRRKDAFVSAFFTLHRDLPREGPGEAADVIWALGQIPRPTRICDVACGPGADIETFADLLPGSQIEAVDRQAHFIDATIARTKRFGGRVKAWQGEMAHLCGPYDLIWCAGAVYFLGVTHALQLWRSALAAGGHIVFSEPVLLGPPSATVQAFWAEVPEVMDAAGIARQVTAAGFRTKATRVIVGAPWEAYYTPQAARTAALRPGAGSELTAVLDEAEAEISIWAKAPDQIAYLLSVVAPE